MDNFNGRKHLCPRLLDYFVIIGNNQTDSYQKYTPQLLRRYPSKDHQDFELPANIVFFCQPEGCIKTLSRKSNSIQQSTTNSFVFALTDKDKNRVRYGICVNFYRLVKLKHHSLVSSTNDSTIAVVDYQNSNLKLTSNNQFLNLNEDEKENNFNLNLDQNKHQYNSDTESLRPESSISQLKKNFKRKSSYYNYKPIFINSLTSLCLISHHPFFSSFRECLFVLKNLIDKCNSKHSKNNYDKNNNEYNTKLYPRKNIIWSLLTGESAFDENEDAHLKDDLKQIESYIYKLLSAPIPIAGTTKIELELIRRDQQSPLIIAYPENTRFSLIDFPLHLPLELLGVECCIQILTCILLENKIILQSRDYNALCMSVMAFVAMLYPLEYMFPVIPLLPTSLESAEQLLLAPTPYIIGIPASFLKSRGKNFHLPNDVWFVDLDANRIIKPEMAEDLPSLPEPEHSILINDFKSALQIMSNNLNHEQKFQNSLTKYENDVDCVDIAVRVALINFYNSPNMLANFTEHTRTIKLYPRPVVTLQINSFLQSRPKRSVFLNKLIHTQALEYYAEYILCPSNLVFLRIHTGVNSPEVVGDKVKWFSDTLEPISFKVWSICENSFCNELLSNNRFLSRTNLNLDLESDNEDYSSDDKHDNLSSSYSSCSSLSDYVNDIFNVNNISFNIANTVLDNKSLYKHQPFFDENQYDPPTKLKLPDDLDKISDSNKKLKKDQFLNETTKQHSNSDIQDEDQSSQYSSNSSISSISITSDESNSKELKLFDTTDYVNNEISTTVQTLKNNFLISNKTKSNKPNICRRSNSISYDLITKCKIFKKFHSYDNILGVNQEIINLQSKNDFQNNKLQQNTFDLEDTSDPKCLNKTKINSKDFNLESSSSILNHKMNIFNAFNRNESLTNSKQNNINTFNKHSIKEVSNLEQYSSIKNQSQLHNKHITTSNFLNRFTKEAKGFTKDALQATKTEMKERKNTFLKSLQSLGNNELNKTSLTNPPLSSTQDNINNENTKFNFNRNFSNSTSNSSINLDKFEFSHEFNGLADKKNSMLSGFFSSKMVDRIKEKVQQQQQQFSQLQQFPGRKGLIERNSLIKHVQSSNNTSEYLNNNKDTISFMNKSNVSRLQHTENQKFLQEIISNILEGEGIGWLKFNRIKKLMEDENYRNFVVLRVNKTFDCKLGPDDYIEDVEISKSVWKGLLKLILAIIHGLKYSYSNNGLFGMQSTLIILEIAHTYYWTKKTNELNESEKKINNKLIKNLNISTLNTSYNLDSEISDLSTNDSVNNLEIINSKKNDINSSTVSSSFLNQKNKEGFLIKNTLSQTCELNEANTKSKTLYCSVLNHNLHYQSGNLINKNLLDTKRTYLYQGLIDTERSTLWNDAQFWEDMFLDAVSQERELIGLDQCTSEMIERYKTLQEHERKRLEHEEDRLLSSLLHNMIAFMVMLKVDNQLIQNKIRRLLGKCYIGVIYSEEITSLLQRLNQLSRNNIALKPLASRRSHKQTFTLFIVNNQLDKKKSNKLLEDNLSLNSKYNLDEMFFMDVRDDGLILRTITGNIVERWWYERLVNMTYCPKSKVLCLWRRNGDQTQLHKYQAKKSKELYYCIKEAIDKAATKSNGAPPGTELGGEFPVQDVQTGEGGLLQVCMEGVGLLFAHSKFFVKLENIQKCFTEKGNIFVLQEFSPKTCTLIERKYKSQMADQICYSVLCVFSYIVAGLNKKKSFMF